MVFSIVVCYWCKRKTLKRNWNWRNNRLFCHIFVIDEISIGGGEARLAKPTLQLRKIKKVFTNFLRGFWRFQQNFNCSKIVLSSSRGQGNFRGPKASRPRPRPRTWGFEAKAKAKDFKMCPRGRPRGQGRPRGLHLWYLYTKCWTQRVSIDVSLSTYSASTVTAPIDLFCVAPLYFWSGRFVLLVCSVCAPHFSSCSQRFKNYALFGNSCTPLCLAELPLFWHSFSFKQLANRRISFSRPLVWHSLSSLFSG